MEKINKFLKQLELSDIEAKIYITLLESGPTTVRELAEAIDIKRTTTYTYINQLIEKGLITEVMKGFHKQIAANQPENLQFLIEKRLETAVTLQKNFPDILKTMGTIMPQTKNSEETEIKYFKGINGVKTIYEEAINSNEIRSYANLIEVRNLFPNNFNIFEEALKKRSKLKIYEIIGDTPDSIKNINLPYRYKRYQYKFISSDVKLASADILIYDNRVSIINIKSTISGIVVHNSDYAKNSKELFDFNWKLLPELDILSTEG